MNRVYFVGNHLLIQQRVDEKPAPNIQSFFKLILIDFEVVSRRMVLCESIGSALILAYKVEEQVRGSILFTAEKEHMF